MNPEGLPRPLGAAAAKAPLCPPRRPRSPPLLLGHSLWDQLCWGGEVENLFGVSQDFGWWRKSPTNSSLASVLVVPLSSCSLP